MALYYINKLKLQWKIEKLIQGKPNLIHFQQTSLCNVLCFCFVLFLFSFSVLFSYLHYQIIKIVFNFNMINYVIKVNNFISNFIEKIYKYVYMCM